MANIVIYFVHPLIQVNKDTRMENSIMCLRVKCQNSGRGCKSIGQLADFLKVRMLIQVLLYLNWILL